MPHDHVTKREEGRSSERLREEVREIIRRAHKGDHDPMVLDALPNEEVSALDVLSPLMVLGVIGQVAGPCVIHAQGHRLVGAKT